MKLSSVFLLSLFTLIFLLFQSYPAFALQTQFDGKSVLGKSVHLNLSQAPKATVLVFLSAKCPCSASHEQVLKELYAKYSASGFQFLGIHSNQDESKILSLSHFAPPASNLPFPVLEDKEAKIASELHAMKTPHVFVLNPKGEILFQGGVDDSHIAQTAKVHHLENALEAIQNGKKPDPAEVRVMGCVIKRSS